MADIRERASFEIIRYANCWEDADILLQGLELAPGMRCLSIASGGDNSFAMLANDPEVVVAADISRAQLALVDLKRAAIVHFDREGCLQFLGFRSGEPGRAESYRKLRDELRPESREFWDAHQEAIMEGVIHAGKFERYFSIFRRKILPLVHSRREILSLLIPKTRQQRTEYYNDHWNSWRWQLLFRVFFSRFVMGRMGRDPEFFRYVEGSVADRILGRVEYALTALPGEENPFMHYILTGNFGDALPLYLRPEHYDSVRRNIGRLLIHEGGADGAASRLGLRFDACNLSDIFEYMHQDLFREVAGRIIDGCASGARIAYWNMLAPRRISDVHAGRVEYQARLSENLFREDKAFFYQAFRIDRVI